MIFTPKVLLHLAVILLVLNLLGILFVVLIR
jgi:hypothetical protein